MRAPREPEHHEPREMGTYREREESNVYVEPAEQPIMSRDLTRWGPIWAGLLAAIGTIVALTTLGTAVGLSTGEAATTGITTAGGIWAAIVMLVGLFIGGWLAARTAAVGGRFMGMVHGSLVWALAVFISVILAAIGGAAALGVILGQSVTSVFGGQVTPGTAAATIWTLFAALIIGLIVAAIGGWIGARSTYDAPPS